jgi:hypothetical protein
VPQLEPSAWALRLARAVARMDGADRRLYTAERAAKPTTAPADPARLHSQAKGSHHSMDRVAEPTGTCASARLLGTAVARPDGADRRICTAERVARRHTAPVDLARFLPA